MKKYNCIATKVRSSLRNVFTGYNLVASMGYPTRLVGLLDEIEVPILNQAMHEVALHMWNIRENIPNYRLRIL